MRFKIKILQTYGCVAEERERGRIWQRIGQRGNEGDEGERVTDVMKELNIEDGEWTGIER
jgi:hypothetical protein